MLSTLLFPIIVIFWEVGVVRTIYFKNEPRSNQDWEALRSERCFPDDKSESSLLNKRHDDASSAADDHAFKSLILSPLVRVRFFAMPSADEPTNPHTLISTLNKSLAYPSLCIFAISLFRIKPFMKLSLGAVLNPNC